MKSFQSLALALSAASMFGAPTYGEKVRGFKPRSRMIEEGFASFGTSGIGGHGRRKLKSCAAMVKRASIKRKNVKRNRAAHR